MGSSYRLRSLRCLIVFFLQLVVLQTSQQLALDENYVSNLIQNGTSSSQDAARKTPATSSHQNEQDQFQGPKSPYIILMADDTVSVAQLPMILFGNIFDIYHLPQDVAIEELDHEGRPHQAHNDEDDDQLEEEEAEPRGLSEEASDGDARRRWKQQHQAHADAREYEQMPHQPAIVNMTAGSVSLGKSEWQQIAASEGDREEVWQPQPATQTNMNRKSSRDEDDAASSSSEEEAEKKRQLGHPRRRRSSSCGNSLSDDDSPANGNNGRAGPAASGTGSDAQTSRRRLRRALESNSNENVTSAAKSEGRQLNVALEGTSDATGNTNSAGGGGAPAEDGREAGGDKTSSPGSTPINQQQGSAPASGVKRVRFSDFDVHMALGYAFVADSVGRIHRFRLPLSGGGRASGQQRPGSLTNNQPGWRLVSNSESSFPSENEDANAIDAGVKFESASRQSKETVVSVRRQHDGRLNSSTVEATATPPASDSVLSGVDHEDGYGARGTHKGTSEDANDALANRVSQRASGGAVTHEQFGSDNGQHPAISGEHSTLAASGSPISVGLKTLDQRLATDNEMSDGAAAKPRVIWSRNKHSRKAPLAANSALRKASSASRGGELQRQQQLANDAKGASTTATSESSQMADELAATADDNESAVDGARKQSDAEQRRRHESGANENQSGDQSSGGGGGCGRPPQLMGGGRVLRTEVAVDWLNNLLFVLDKCRLLVMDFDGNNELVLIDDFTPANRPVDIKVDPVNDFLFWLQVGKFHNTIYKLDLSVLSMQSATQKLVSNALRLRQSMSASAENASSSDASNLVPLVSHHYAHPIITNLPRSAQIFSIDHEHSKIYVPLVTAPPPSLSPSVNTDRAATSTAADHSKRADDAEIFASTGDATHLNSTDPEMPLSSDDSERNCSQTSNALPVSESGQILAYNLDGTDVGPFRTVGARAHISSLDNMQDLTLDSANNLLYWLTNDGKDLFEEFKENSTIQPAQHYLNGRSYSKLIYLNENGSNQPRASSRSKLNVRKIIHSFWSSISFNRPPRSGGLDQVEQYNYDPASLKVRPLEVDSTRFSRNAPFIILGVTCLIVVTVYLVYALIFQQQSARDANENAAECREGSMSGGSSSIGDSNVESNLNGFINSNTISRWIAGPSVRSADTSTFNRSSGDNGGPYDLESTTIYEASNAIDEHYRDSMVSNANQLLDISSAGRLANLTGWPTNILDRSNKLYVPVEVLQDEALSSIRRVSIDQLEIEKTTPLGEGHFGTVLQGKIRCTVHERTNLLDRTQMMNTTFTGPISPDSLAPPLSARAFAVSSASSGHGSSSSTSCEFTTANSCTEPTNDEDYLTPKNQLNSVSSDYCPEMPHSSIRDDSCIEYCDTIVPDTTQQDASTSKVSTKLMVAIKKLKDNASADMKRDFLQEAKLLANFDHPNIVHLIGICLDRGSTLIVMELMLGGDLTRYMQENMPNPVNNFNDTLTYDDLLKVCLDIVNGCCYLEDMDYIHRDLAARNCLVSSRKREERVVKLADFGLARDIYKDSYYKKLNDSAMPLKWMAPECLIEQKFTKKSDVWSFGIVLWEVMIYCQEKPFASVETFYLKEHLAGGGRLRKPEGCDDNMYRLMNQCWQMRPEDRPTFHECRAMLIEIRNGARLRDSV